MKQSLQPNPQQPQKSAAESSALSFRQTGAEGRGQSHLAQLAATINQSPRVQTQLKLAEELQSGAAARGHNGAGESPVQRAPKKEKLQKKDGPADKKKKPGQLQAKPEKKKPPAQKAAKKEKPKQMKFDDSPAVAQMEEAPSANRTGLPDQIKTGVEGLSGISLDDVKVHYNSGKPKELNALAYAQGTDIHVAPGQEKHLPHEAWHIVQQKQGRVQPTVQMKEGVPINDDPGLEHEADLMGAKALQRIAVDCDQAPSVQRQEDKTVQRVTLKEMFDALKDNVDQLAAFSNWLTARAGNNDADRDYLLSRMSQLEVVRSVELYEGRKRVEKQQASITIDDVASGKATLPATPGKEIDTLMLSSPQIGEFAAQKAAQGIKVENSVVVLHDADFTQKHWEDFYALNRELFDSQPPSVISTIRLREAALVDRVDGFQSSVDGKIYMRPGKLGFRIAVHEAVHKFGGGLFTHVFGHPMNEGATDYIAMLVCGQIGAEIETAYYAAEKKLLIEVLGALGISDAELFSAYFDDNVDGVLKKLTNAIGDEHAVLFRKAKTVPEAATAFNQGRAKKKTK